LYKKSENAGFKILDEAKEPIEKVIKFFCNVEEIGNGRFVDRVLQEIIIKHAKNENEEIDVITKEDIPTIKEITNVINAQNMIDPDKVSKEDLMKTAIHETGHAVLRLLLTKKAGIKKITINAEGTGSLGYVEYEAIKEKYTSSKEELLNRIKVCLGGMVAEKVFIGYYENGATSDLSKATNIAKNIVTRYGMSDLGYAKIDDLNNGMAPIVYEEINKILGECFKDAEKIITENKEKIQNVIDYLYEHKEIEEEQLIANFK
jgi:ATP-dependent Zn protease